MTPWVLLVLKQWSIHGYLIVQHLNRMGFSEVDHPTLYRELRRLESQGYVASKWETGGSGPAKRGLQHHRSRRRAAQGLDRDSLRLPANDNRLLRPLLAGFRVSAAATTGRGRRAGS